MISVVIPTLGRPSLTALLDALASRPDVPVPTEVLLVDDRRAPGPALPDLGVSKVLAGPGAGPAAARNVGWRAASHDWIVFLDDDVLPHDDWWSRLVEDLTTADGAGAERVGGVQGRLRVPLPAGRRPTDWERVSAGLADGRWITADMAYRRAALEAVGGFDERFPRAYREDAELAHRVRAAGWALRRGARQTTHPVRPESPWVSVRTQRGNADDALLRRLYGTRWRDVLDVPPGRRRHHLAVTAALAGAGLAAVTGHRRAAAVCAAAWLAGTAEFAVARIAPGPRTVREIAAMAVTSVVIPVAASAHWVRGRWRWRTAVPVHAGGVSREAGLPSISAGSRQP